MISDKSHKMQFWSKKGERGELSDDAAAQGNTGKEIRMRRIILASGSPRRKQLLESAGFSVAAESADIDESRGAHEEPAEYAARMAYGKAETVARRHFRVDAHCASGERKCDLDEKRENSMPERATVVAADTIVICDGRIFGKPASPDEAFSMLKQLCGRCHDVLTAVAVADIRGGKISWRRFSVVTHVEFGDVSDERLRAYVASGDPADKAGGYGIQGAAGVFVRRIEGSYTNVVGLPLYETAQCLLDGECG